VANLYGDDDNPIVEVLIDGTWTDVSARVRDDSRISITRGRADEQARTASQRASLTFDNADGFFSTRLPSSVNYRKIGKNTQVRMRAGSGGNHLRMLYNDLTDLTGAETADKASLDVTGDLDIRAEIWPHSWRLPGGMVLAAKYQPDSNQRSWLFRMNALGQIILNWSTTGTLATTVGATSDPVPVPASGRLAVRATLDVDNGAAGRTITFYTSDSIAGTWTILGSAFVQAGVTSVFASTAVLAIGRGSTLAVPVTSSATFGGRMYRLQVYSGIAGTLVADFNPGAQALGATSWSDGLASPNTWTVAGLGSRVTSDRVRFWGELASLPKEWDRSGADVTVPAQAAGMLRRLSQGAKPLDPAMTRNFKRQIEGTFGWWPLEDESQATSAVNLAPGVAPLAVIKPGRVTDVTFGATEAPPGAKSSMSFNSSASRFYGPLDLKEQVAPYTYTITFYIKVSALPASSKTFATIDFFGSPSRIDIALTPTAWEIGIYDLLGTLIANQATAIAPINPANGWVGYQLLLEDDGTDVSYSQRWDTIGTFGGGVGPTTIAGLALPPPFQVRLTAANDSVYESMNISHVFVSQSATFDLSDATYRDASNAYRGETAGARLSRLSDEEGVTMEITGLLDDTEAMGYQTIKTFPDLVAECWEVDGGIGGEARDALALEYRTRADMESRQDLVLSHALHDLSEVPRPTDDDQGFTNDVTVTRTGGSAARAIVTEGYTSVYDPPTGVGRYETDVTRNAASDDQLPSIAGWAALTGSWDQDRYPGVRVALHRARLLADDALYAATVGARLGDTITLTGLPAWMPPNDVPQLIQGYTEQLSHFLWEIDYNCTPAGPYQAVPVVGSDVYVPRLDAVDHTIGGALTTTTASVSFVTPPGSAPWVDSATYPGDFPFDVVIGGEVISVTAITGTASPQTASLTRSINGVVKSHDSGAGVRLARPFYVGR
jgi:hypothetical protein